MKIPEHHCDILLTIYTVEGILVHVMKELRASKDGALRVLFAFDPRRSAILLLGGDKTGNWKEWYEINVAHADDLFDEHLQELAQEGLT